MPNEKIVQFVTQFRNPKDLKRQSNPNLKEMITALDGLRAMGAEGVTGLVALLKSDAEGVASNSIVKVESPTDGTIENSTEQIALVEGGDATVDSTRGMGLALIFALLALVCLALVLLLYFRKRNS